MFLFSNQNILLIFPYRLICVSQLKKKKNNNVHVSSQMYFYKDFVVMNTFFLHLSWEFFWEKF